MKGIGAVAAGFGVLIATAGIAILVIFGSDGLWKTDRHLVASTTPALVSESADIHGITGAADALGEPGIRIDLTDGRFVGVGRAGDVERWLADTTYDEVTDLETGPFELVRHTVHGARAIAPPGDQSFWVAEGTDALRWKMTDGDYRIVIASADGYSPLVTTGTFGIKIPKLPAIATGLVLFGALWVAAGAGLLVNGRRQRAYA